MDMQVEGLLPFKVGQLAESRSFLLGYRSAWFRCKIKETSCKKGIMEFALEFYDFPDDKVKWTRIYQVPKIGRKRATKVEKMLMLRPQYPPICSETEAHADTISEVKVARNGVWNVGDLVDWWSDGCYWSGKVTKILGDEKVQVELPPPPIGEGSSYEALCNDLRPSLDWSPEHGWSVLTSQEKLRVSDWSNEDPSSRDAVRVQEGKENYHPCARLIMPLHQAGLPIGTVDVGIQNVGATAGSMLDASFHSPISTNALPPVNKSEQSITKAPTRQPLSIGIPQEEQRPQPNTDLDMRDSAIKKTGVSQRIGHVEEAGISLGEDQYYSSGSAKKMRTGGTISLNSMRSDTIEAPIMDLEELVNKVKWLKGILESGVPLPNARRPLWKFVEHHGSSAPE
ncbi:hypothetical protein RHMOL_Rhmol02G0036800 [Rhododendron molle]|uniref:Uncharacterized protein n=4 Tax=Rhododendron molle TaxID=49168 RepID=A0ACC0PML8_RHOML|nr:hypothetical protein RHMOL_Rhmol02G0036800 [Rhododendron molle]KAI8566389.1 hypothetical protein RHMOL_Rhmol02G0036800 [Rhododendron molle]KAI8566390.1 hypothetical protein RHMOL_Rhmol02G0036800 [Rhododendron molle]KAI8566391.1 hypothetical protein RHMOL_Rhmol02G0036800 [Rhododendron molle]